jgi:hypothetical protein
LQRCYPDREGMFCIRVWSSQFMNHTL